MKTIGLTMIVCLLVSLCSGCASLEADESNIGDYDLGSSRFDMDAP